VWAQDVNVAVDVLHTKLQASRTSRDEWTDAHTELADGVCQRLQAARDATLRRQPSPGRLSNWWRGTLIEAAYQNLHAAESLMVHFYSAEQVEAEIPEAVARVEAGLDRDDPRRIAALSLLAESQKSAAAGEAPDARTVRTWVAGLAKTMEIGFSAADTEFLRLRNFRNTVLAGAFMLTFVVAVFTVFVWLNPSDVPFCFVPDPNKGDVCASGGATPSSHDVVTVTLMGTLGGLLAAIMAIKSMRGSPSPYDVPKALALLKLPLGAVTAIGGLIAIRGDFIPGFSQLDSQAQIVAYAFAFGVAQQLLTRLVDRHASALLERIPGKAAKVARDKRAPQRQAQTDIVVPA
jgi:hypothetical protein